MSRSYPAGGLALLWILAAGGQATAQERDTVPAADTAQPAAMPVQTGNGITHVRFVNAVPTLSAATLSLGGQNLFSNVAYRSATPYMTVTSITGTLNIAASTEGGGSPPAQDPAPTPGGIQTPADTAPAPVPAPSDSVPAPAPAPMPPDSAPAPAPEPTPSDSPTPAPTPTDTIGRQPEDPTQPITPHDTTAVDVQAEAPSAVAVQEHDIKVEGSLEEGGYYTIVAVADENGAQRLRVLKDEVAQPAGDVAARADEGGKARVRLVYAIPGRKTDIGFQGEEPVWDDFSVTSEAEYKEIDPSKTTLLVQPDEAEGEGTQVGSLSFQAGQNYTVVLTGNDAQVDVLQLQDGVSTTEAPSTPAVTEPAPVPTDTTIADPAKDPSTDPTTEPEKDPSKEPKDPQPTQPTQPY